MKTLPVYLIVICLSWATTSTCHDLSKFALSQKWLGHFFYEKRGDQFKSLVASPRYFLSPTGQTDPQGELSETIKRLQSSVPMDSSEYCRFISRYELVLNQFPELRKPFHKCIKFEEWHNKLSIDEVRLAFATGYIKNPASSFGHLFLKLVSKSKPSELLSYGINFSAQTGSESGALYALKGLFGLYSGGFVFLPYHQLIKDYSDLEGRDIWEYSLELTTQEIRRLLTFIYEFDANYIDYTFLKYNCAGVLERLIYTIKDNPGFRITSIKPWIIPSESFRKIANGISTKRYRYQPSLKTQRGSLENQLSLVKKKEIKNELNSKNKLKLSTNSLDYLLLDKKIESSSFNDEHYSEILLERSRRVDESFSADRALLLDEAPMLERPDSSMIAILAKRNSLDFEFALLSDRILYGQGLSEVSILNVYLSNSKLVDVDIFSFLAGESVDFLHQPLSFGGGVKFKDAKGLVGHLNFGYILKTDRLIYFPSLAGELNKLGGTLFPRLDLYYFFDWAHCKFSIDSVRSEFEIIKIWAGNYSLSAAAEREMATGEAEGLVSVGHFF